MAHEDVTNYHAEVLRVAKVDAMEIRVESARPSKALASRISSSVKAACNVTPKIQFVAPGVLGASGKTRRLMDSRK